MISLYLYKLKKPYIMSLIPGMFYTYIISTYLLNAKIGFNLPLNIATIAGIVIAFVYAYLIIRQVRRLYQAQKD